MMRWDIRRVEWDAVDEWLLEGWEPFAIDSRGSGIGAGRYVTVYLKRLIPRA